MSTAIYTKNTKESNSWRIVLQEELPDQTIEVYPSIADYNDVEFLICWKPYHGLIAQFPNLKAIQSLGAGVDHIFDANTIDAHIQVSKIVDDQLTQDMWEHTLSIVMADMKNFAFFKDKQQNRTWKPRRYKRIKDIKIGILGLGTIGKYVATQFETLGFQVTGWSRSTKSLPNIMTYMGQEGINQVCSNSDYLINILPLTIETKGIMNKGVFVYMKPSSYFINVGRGSHVVDNDLIECLDNEILRGAALDVFQIEPLSDDHPFWSHLKILITPHIASLTNIESVYPQVIENIRRLDSGLPLLNLIDVGKGY